MTTKRLVVGITGATGHLGGLLLERLVRDPSVGEVRSVARRPLARPPGSAPERVVHTQADLSGAVARGAFEGVDVLYHLAAQVWQGPGPRGALEMRTTNLEGTRNMLLARPGAFVLASSVSVYGAWPDNPLPAINFIFPIGRNCGKAAGEWGSILQVK